MTDQDETAEDGVSVDQDQPDLGIAGGTAGTGPGTDQPVDQGNLPSFLFAALLADLDLIPPEERPAKIARVASISTRGEASEYLSEMAERAAAFKDAQGDAPSSSLQWGDGNSGSFWLVNLDCELVIDIASGTPLLASIANSPSQFFVYDGQGRFVCPTAGADSGWALTAPAGADAPTLSTPGDDPSQYWTVGADGTLVSDTGLVLAVPMGATEGAPALLAPQGAAGPTATWEFVPVPTEATSL